MSARRHRRRRAPGPFPAHPSLRHLVALLLASAAAAFAAQAPSPQAVATFGEAIEVRRLNVDVVVVDAADRPVDGLGRDDFELYEDGRQVEILNFAAYQDVLPRGPAVAATFGNGNVSSAAPGPVSWVIYVDSGKVNPGPRNDATKHLREFLAAEAGPEDRLLVAGFDGTALHLLAPLTTDRAAVDAALAALSRGASDAVERRSRARALIQNLQDVNLNLRARGPEQATNESGRRASLADPRVEADHFWLQLESYVTDESQRERLALRALDQLLGMVSGIDGRVALLFVGAPIEVSPGDPIVRRALAELGSSPDGMLRLRDVQSRQSDLSPDLRHVLERANAGRVTIYTVDAGEGRELGTNPVEEHGLPGLTEGAHSGSGSASASVALAVLANSTGGRAFAASPELARRLTEVATDLRSYYSLAYEPPRPVPGGFHHLEVRLKRAGLVARYRQGLREREPGEIAGDAAVAALLGEPPANAFGLRVRVDAPDKTASRARRKLTPIHIELPLSALLLAPEAAVHRGQVDFTFALLDEHDALTRTASKRLDFTIPNARLAQALAEFVSYDLEMPLGKGSYRLAVVAVDRVSGERSTLVAPFTVAAQR